MSKSRPSKSRSRSELRTVKTYRAGRITRNPFLNFLRDYRVSNKGLSVTEVISKGAQVWRSMTDQQKASYLAMAKEAPIRRYRRRRRSRGRRGRRSGRRRRRGRRARDEESDNEDYVSSTDDDDDDDDERNKDRVSSSAKNQSPSGTQQQ